MAPTRSGSSPRISVTPPESVATTGRPDASASTATTPNVSRGLGWTNRAAWPIAAAMPRRSAVPSIVTASSRPRSAIRRRHRASVAGSGARPMSRSVTDGRSERATAVARSSVSIPFDSLR
jgi:hypothetical protein